MSRARVIPAVDFLLGQPSVAALAGRHGARAVRTALEHEMRELRAALVSGRADAMSRDSAVILLVDRLTMRLAADGRASLRRVVNATGVIIHTNLGRAPLSPDALAAMQDVAGGYSSLEFDLGSGQRGSRHAHLGGLLADATGAETGVAVNNTAAGVTLVLAALAAGREVIISRGELVEIGGGFRVPDILRSSGALLREVGTTNRTRVSDYTAAITDRTAAILRVHPSNFRMEGFTARPSVTDIAAEARRFGVPLIEDQGSGWLGFDLFPPDAFPAAVRAVLAREPAVRDSVRDGADIVVFSGDKLLGGPQAGLIVGRADLLARVTAHPMMRAVRTDKVTYAGLDATLRAIVAGRGATAVPVLRMIATPRELLAVRADRLAQQLRSDGVACDLVEGHSVIGGGSAPGSELPTTLVRIAAGLPPDTLLTRLRLGTPSVVARIVDDRVTLDPRTLPDEITGTVVAALRAALADGIGSPPI